MCVVFAAMATLSKPRREGSEKKRLGAMTIAMFVRSILFWSECLVMASQNSMSLYGVNCTQQQVWQVGGGVY